MLSVPFFQGAEPAHIYFLTLPKILHTLQKCVQGPCTPCWQLISGRINRARTVCPPKTAQDKEGRKDIYNIPGSQLG